MRESIRAKMPEDPQKRLARFVADYGLPEADARQLIEHRRIADYFEAAAKGTKNSRTAANCILEQMFARFGSEAEKDRFEVAVSPAQLHDLILLLDAGKIRKNLIKSTLEKMLDSGKPASDFLSEKDLAGISAEDLRAVCRKAAEENAAAVADYRAGKKKALGAIVGAVMKATKGRANPQETQKILTELLKG